eukprot:6204785-Pleurochrysis_carterae.AAC.1
MIKSSSSIGSEAASLTPLVTHSSLLSKVPPSFRLATWLCACDVAHDSVPKTRPDYHVRSVAIVRVMCSPFRLSEVEAYTARPVLKHYLLRPMQLVGLSFDQTRAALSRES